MKDKIIMLILGIVIGAILAGACFWFATTVTKSDDDAKPETTENFERGKMQDENMGQRNDIESNTTDDNQV